MVVDLVANADAERLVSFGKQQHEASLWNLRNGGKLAQLNHSAALRSIDLSSNGQLAATADESGSIKVWRTRDGSLLHTINHEAGRLRLQFLPDDRLLAYVECIRAGETSELTAWTLSPMSVEKQFKTEANVAFARIDEGSQSLIVSGTDGAVSLFSIETGKIKQGPFRHQGRLEDCYIAEDKLLTVQRNGTITVWSMDGTRRELTRHSTGILDSTLDKRRRILAVGGTDGQVALYWRHSLQRIGPALFVDESISSLEFHPDSRRLIAGGNSGIVRIWDLAGMAPDVSILKHDGQVNVARFNPSGTRVISCSNDKTGALWDAQDGSLISKHKHSDHVTDCGFSAGGRFAATGSLDGTVQILDGRRGVALGDPLQHTGGVLKLGFSPGTSDVLFTAASNGVVTGWDAASRKRIFQASDATTTITDLAIAPDGESVIIGAVDGLAVVRRAKDGSPVSPPLVHKDIVTRCGYSRQGDSLLWTASRDNSVRFWLDGDSYELKNELTFRAWPTNVAFSPEGDRYLISDFSGHLSLWQEESLLWRFARPKHFFKHCEIDSQSRFALACGGATLGDGRRIGTGSAFLVDLESGLPVAPPLNHFATIRAFFDPSGQRILTSSDDQSARLWNIVTDDRPVDAISLHAMAVSGKKLNSSEQLVSLEPTQLADVFQEAKDRSAEWFECDTEQIGRWEDYIAWVVEKHNLE